VHAVDVSTLKYFFKYSDFSAVCILNQTNYFFGEVIC